MANATDNRKWIGDATNNSRTPVRFASPMAAGAEIFAGCLVGAVLADADRPLTKMATDASTEIRGFAARHVNNVGGQKGDLHGDVLAVTGILDPHGVHPPVIGNLWEPMYCSDDHTVSNNSGDGPCIGVLVDFDAVTGNPVVLVDPFIANLFAGGYLSAGAVTASALANGAVGYIALANAVHGAFSTRTGAGAVDLTKRTAKITSGATGAAMTVANGTVAGQRLSLDLVGLTTKGVHTAVITPASGGPWTTDTVGDSLEIEWDGTNWIIVHDLRAVTRPPMPRILSGVGSNGAGACTLVGAKVGDVVASVQDITDHVQHTAAFEAVITVADQIQQSSATDYSAKTIVVQLRPLS